MSDFDRPTRIRRWFMFHLDVYPNPIYLLSDPIQKAMCVLTGHVPERDHCGRPEHDFCCWCQKAMPNSWVRPDV